MQAQFIYFLSFTFKNEKSNKKCKKMQKQFSIILEVSNPSLKIAKKAVNLEFLQLKKYAKIQEFMVTTKEKNALMK